MNIVYSYFATLFFSLKRNNSLIYAPIPVEQRITATKDIPHIKENGEKIT